MYKIGDFAKQVDTSITTLRYYDSIDLFKPDEIDLYTNYRYYSENKIEEFNTIKNLQEAGFSIEEIKENWNMFSSELMLTKRKELTTEIDRFKDKIKKLDYIRSRISNGKIIEGEYKEPIKKKTLM